MKLRISLAILLLLSTIVASQVVVHAAPLDWEPVAPGVEYRQYDLPDPNKVYVARMDRGFNGAIIESSIAQGSLSSGLETVSSMFRRYDQALNNWGDNGDASWGARNQVAVAINGSFTLPGTTLPWQGQFYSGWYAWRFADSETRNAFGWKLDRTPFIGDCVRHPAGKNIVIFANNETQEILGVNISRSQDGLYLYTPQYGRDTATDGNGFEVLLEVTRPTMVDYPDASLGIVRAIYDNQGSTPIPFDHVVLSAVGQAVARLKNNIQMGDQVKISQFIRNCDPDMVLDWRYTYAGLVSNDYYFLKDGQYQYNPEYGANIRNPRTAVAFNNQYVYFIIVDGRYPGVSLGMTMEELATFSIEYLQAEQGLSLDGGGSSTMVVNGVVVNFPSDGVPKSAQGELASIDVDELGVSDHQSLVDGTYPIEHQQLINEIYLPVILKDTTSQGAPIIERPVPNGLMMVVVQPMDLSTNFTPGDVVLTSLAGETPVRLGPGINYPVLANLPPGSSGDIVDHSNGLNGVLAKNEYWWKVDFGNLQGWVTESALQRP